MSNCNCNEYSVCNICIGKFILFKDSTKVCTCPYCLNKPVTEQVSKLEYKSIEMEVLLGQIIATLNLKKNQAILKDLPELFHTQVKLWTKRFNEIKQSHSPDFFKELTEQKWRELYQGNFQAIDQHRACNLCMASTCIDCPFVDTE